MYEFLERLLAVALPNVRDFQGVSRKLDGRGNYNLGISDHSIFPEIMVEPGRNSLGFDITIVTSAKTDDEGRELLSLMGMPFRRISTAA
jgi:large subunit ribosomal protein L5